MSEIEAISERPLTMVEVKEMLAEIKKKAELGFRANKTNEYVGFFAKKKGKEVEDIKKKMEELNIMRLKPKTIAKLIDIEPADAEGVKAILAAENTTVKQEDVGKILECLQ